MPEPHSSSSVAPDEVAPEVSVVIPTKNRADLLSVTLQSLAAQEFRNWEAVVVDDGSTDEDLRTIESLVQQDRRVRFVRRTSPLGGANVCRNLGVASTSGELVLFLDSDDVLDPDCLSGRVAVMRQDPELDFTVFGHRNFSGDPQNIQGLDAPDEGDEIERLLQLKHNWLASGVFWRRSTLQQLGLWDETLPSWQDWDINIRALASGVKYRRLARADWRYRVPLDGSQAISKAAFLREHLERRSVLFDDTRRRLTEAGLFNDRRRKLLAALNLYHCEWIALKLSAREAIARWRECRRQGLIDRWQYLEGFFYFRLWRRGNRGRRLLRRYLKKRWRPDYEFVN